MQRSVSTPLMYTMWLQRTVLMPEAIGGFDAHQLQCVA